MENLEEMDKFVERYNLPRPNQDEIDKHSGVYDDVMQSLSTVRYSDAKALHNDLISHQMTELKSNPYVRETNPSYEQIGMLIQSIMKR